jgi:hypothetical protein
MGEKSVTEDEILAEIIAYLSEPDYFAEGWRTTRDLSEALGKDYEYTRNRLEREVKAGRMETILDRSRRAWWRVAKV